MQSIELLAPARNLECGLEAIRHGADAVYIGAPRFGARAAAGNSIADIAKLTAYAHPFGVKIYVTVNTLLRDDELAEVDALIGDLAQAGVDALIVQDVRLIAINRGRLPLHASTQMDNRTVADVQARLADGYEQTVLARELSLDEIRTIHEAVPSMALEAFVHGALCVSYSGRCYASEYCFGRSANRGECAQFCRLPFDLVDADGRVATDPHTRRPLAARHLLSLRDMNRSADLEAMMDAGVSSFKIEGRLKDVSYVKNVTAYYRQQLDRILERRASDYCRSSRGESTFTFTPAVEKSFNRRFTDYFLHGRTREMACFSTPKSLGEPVGTVKDVRPDSLAVAGTATFANGDGLCFFDADDRLQGFRVNRVDAHGRLYPAELAVLRSLRKGLSLYRNYDAAFERLLARPSAERRIPIRWLLTDEPDGLFHLILTTSDGRSVSRAFDYPRELARSPQDAPIRRQLIRLGDTPYTAAEADVTIRFSSPWFIPASVLAEWRRALTSLDPLPVLPDSPPEPVQKEHSVLSSWHPCREGAITFEGCNHSSSQIHSAPPLEGGRGGGLGSWGSPLMTCRYCLRHALGYCTRDWHPLPWREPLALRLSDGRTFPLRFDCRRCQMQVLPPASQSPAGPFH
ncbi:MAG: U32 family peptidase [Bacteroidaceae bacterium]|nr:U32 family peptidase [Bacteroidaceae bacterium]